MVLLGAQILEALDQGLLAARRMDRRRRNIAQGKLGLIELVEQFGDHRLERADRRRLSRRRVKPGLHIGELGAQRVQRLRLVAGAGVLELLLQPANERFQHTDVGRGVAPGGDLLRKHLNGMVDPLGGKLRRRILINLVAQRMQHLLERSGIDGRRRRLVELGADLPHHAGERLGVDGDRALAQLAQDLFKRRGIDDGHDAPIDARAKISDHALEGVWIDGGRPVELGADFAHRLFQRSGVEKRFGRVLQRLIHSGCDLFEPPLDVLNETFAALLERGWESQPGVEDDAQAPARG